MIEPEVEAGYELGQRGWMVAQADGKGGKVEHVWPDGTAEPDRHPKDGPPPAPKSSPEDPQQHRSFCQENPLVCIILPLLPLIIPPIIGLPPIPVPV